MSELDEFRHEVEAWFRENRPPDPGFLLPESFMEVGLGRAVRVFAQLATQDL